MSPRPTPLIRSLLSGSSWVFLAEALAVPTGLITAGLLTRKLGTSEYGLLTLTATIVGWVEWSVASVLGRASIKFVSETSDWRPVGTALVRWHLILGIVAAVAVLLAAAPLEVILDEPGLAPLMQLMAIGIPIFSVAQAHRNMLAGKGDFNGRAASVAGRWLVRLGLILLFVEAGLRTSGAALAVIGAMLAELLICRCYICPAFIGPCAPMQKLWAFAVPLFLAGLSFRVFEKLDLLALKTLGGTSEQAGWYGAAQNLALLPSLISMSFGPVFLGMLGRELSQGNVDGARGLARDTLRAVVLMLPLPAIIAGSSLEITRLIFGPAFAPAASNLSILIFGSSAIMSIAVTSCILTAVGRAGLVLKLTLPLVPAAVVGHYFAVPAFGPSGAAIVTTAGASIAALVQLIVVQLYWGILPAPATFVRAVLSAVLAGTFAAFLPTPGALLFLKLPAACLIALIALYAFGEFASGEVAAVRAMLPRRLIPTRH